MLALYREMLLVAVLMLVWSGLARGQEDRWWQVIPSDSTESVSGDARDTGIEKLLIYEAGKKDVGVAVLLGLLIPGGGNYYAGDILGGTLLLSAAIAGLVLASSESTASIGEAMVVAAVITSPIAGGLEASSRNKKLKRELQIGLRVAPGESPSLALLYRF